MAPRSETFGQALTGLWFSLTTVFAAGLFVALSFFLFPGKVIGWLYYLTFPEMVYEVTVCVIFLALLAAILGGVCTAVAAPFLRSSASRGKIAGALVAGVSAVGVFMDLYLALLMLEYEAQLSGSRAKLVLALYCVGFVLCLLNPKARQRVTSTFDFLLGQRTRSLAILVIAVGVIALVVAGRTAPASAKVQRGVAGRHPNILLITFDAMSADDMSLYGYRLPTTPRLAEFASKGTVFSNFYSASTFTTPSAASIMTGLAPSEARVYQLWGRLRGPRLAQTLPRVLHDSGYVTAAVASSPVVHFFTSWFSRDIDFFEGPVYRTSSFFMNLWNASAFLHPLQPFGSRLDEFAELERAADSIPMQVNAFDHKLFAHSQSEFPPEETFKRAREVMARLPQGYFLWIHVFAPHYPYLPGAHLGRFLRTAEMRTGEEQVAFMARTDGFAYPPDLQPQVDKVRLRYDEFMADADSAFGDFLSGLEADGKLADTAVIVSADHGESFQGGFFRHEHAFQALPEIHIPLIVRMPGQDHQTQVDMAADQTSLAPTILEIAGLPRADWMYGPSLVPWLNAQPGDSPKIEGRGLAFNEFLETDSVFFPVRSGTAGVTDGVHQYVLDLGTGEATLRNIAEPLVWNIDRSAEEPEVARELRAELYSRFPDLPRK
jgi:arylsulfatase A-like enzyme